MIHRVQAFPNLKINQPQIRSINSPHTIPTEITDSACRVFNFFPRMCLSHLGIYCSDNYSKKKKKNLTLQAGNIAATKTHCLLKANL